MSTDTKEVLRGLRLGTVVAIALYVLFLLWGSGSGSCRGESDRSNVGVIPGALDQANLGDRIAAIGPWQGETTNEVIELLREGRDETHRKLPDLL